jgi:hypothetical protein
MLYTAIHIMCPSVFSCVADATGNLLKLVADSNDATIDHRDETRRFVLLRPTSAPIVSKPERDHWPSPNPGHRDQRPLPQAARRWPD